MAISITRNRCMFRGAVIRCGFGRRGVRADEGAGGAGERGAVLGGSGDCASGARGMRLMPYGFAY
jgi:hypothetical protein